MFSILRRKTGQTKPPLGAMLVPGHPLASGLQSLFLCNAGAGTLLADATGRADASSASLSWGAYGALFNGSFYASFTNYTVSAQPYAFFAVFLTTSSNTGIIGGADGSACLRYTASDQIQITRVNQADIATSSAISALNNRVIVVATSGNVTGDANVQFGYGGKIESVSASAQTFSGVTNTLGVRSTVQNSGLFSGQIEMAGFANRKWLNDEIFNFMAAPYAGFWSPSNILYSFGSSSSYLLMQRRRAMALAA